MKTNNKKLIEKEIVLYIAGKGKVKKKIKVSPDFIILTNNIMKKWKKALDELAKY